MLDPVRIASLRKRVASLSAAQRRLLRQRLQRQGVDWSLIVPDEARSGSAKVSAERPAHLPLSASQAHVWTLHQLYPGLTAYHIPFAWSFRGPLDGTALGRALDAVGARHEALRTVFRSDARGRPYQHVLDAPSLTIRFEELATVDDSAAAGVGDPLAGLPQAVRERAAEIAAEPFDLEAGPLMRVHALRVAQEHHVLVIVLHHLIADGWSRGVLLRELAAAYCAAAGREVGTALPTPPIQYADHVLRERALREGDEASAHMEYWKSRLDGVRALELPADGPRPPGASFEGGTRAVLLPHSLKDALRASARHHGVTQFMLLLTAFKLLLYRYTGHTDIAVGVPVSGRLHEDTAPLIGFFVNTLVMRTRLPVAPTASFADWLRLVRETVAGALEHQAVPFADVVEACAPERTLGRNPLFEVMFQAQTDGYRTQNSARPDVGFAGLELTQHAVPLDQTKFDMSWHLLERDDGLLVAVEYRVALFDEARVERMLGHFRHLLHAVASAPDVRIGELTLLTPNERAEILASARGRPAAPGLDFPAAFLDQALRTPDVSAVRDAEGGELSYRQLADASAALARQLNGVGLGAEQTVGVCLPRRADLLVALLGVLRAGAAYVPLDPSLPPGRIAWMIRDAGCRLVVSDAATIDELGLDPETVGCPPANLEDLAEARAATAVGALPDRHPDQLAYVMYTSGSSGRPKATMIAHRGLAHYLDWCRRAYPLTAGSHVPVHGSVGFDATLTALFAPLLVGRTVNLLRQRDELGALADALFSGDDASRDHAPGTASLVKLTPSHLQALAPLLEQKEPAAGLPAALVIGGEALTAQHVAFWRERHPEVALLNEYGPTETVVGCCVHRVDPGDAGRLPIGRPIDGIRMYVLDADLELQPFGVPGELYIGGPAVARGYLAQPGLTAARFVPDPFVEAGEAGTLYRTGDLACLRDDGVLLFRGRADAQLKLRGHRIEPGEIEARLVAHPAVAAAAVAVRSPAGRPQLVAFVCAELPDEALDHTLRPWLAGALPDFMIPTHYRAVAELPLTVNGKLDRDALPELDLASYGEPVAPRNDVEERLLAVWRDALGQPELGVLDNFFDRGGDSITGMQVVTLAREAGLRLTPEQLFQHQTIAAQARVATPIETGRDRHRAVPTGSFPLLPVQWMLLDRLDEARGHRPSHYNQGVALRVAGTLDSDRLSAALTALVAHHDALRLTFARDRATGAWSQRYAPVEASGHGYEEIDLTAEADFAAAFERAVTARQAGFDLARAPLFAALHVRAPDGIDDRLVLVAHHLVVDAVSWRILVSDLARLYGQTGAAAVGESATRPVKTASYGAYVAHLAQQAGHFEAETRYWQSVCRPTSRLSSENPDATRGGESGEYESELSPDATGRLLGSEAARRVRGVDTMLLGALATTLAQWWRLENIVIDVEGHGRHALTDDLDLSRTVGWFTCIHPVRIDTGRGRDIRREAREALASTPSHGLGYGVLRAMGTPGVVSPAETSLNYLGRISEVEVSDETFLGVETAPLPAMVAGENPRPYLIEVVALVRGDRLVTRWRFDPSRLSEATVAALATRLSALLESYSTQSLAPEKARPTATGVSPASLDTLVKRIGRRRP